MWKRREPTAWEIFGIILLGLIVLAVINHGLRHYGGYILS